MLEFFSRANADFIKQLISLTEDDQIIDVGGGTAQTSRFLHEDFNMRNPVVCIDPSKEMLNVAQRNGAVTIESTAEEFLASKPSYPLKVVCMNGCIHHFADPDFVFSQLASFMPEDGVCIVTMYTIPLFKGANNIRSTERIKEISKLVNFESKGLKCTKAESLKTGMMNKALWYESIRNRLSSYLSLLSNEELEKGIEKLEEDWKDQTEIKIATTVTALVITKNRDGLVENLPS